MSERADMSGLDKTGKRNRILAAALGFVATTGACGAFGTFATFENRSLFGDETSANRPLVAKPKNDALATPTGFKAFLVGADDYADALDLACVKNDVEALAARLIEIGFKPENVTVLKTGGSFEDFPTKANVETRFAAFLETLAPGDFVVVYLSGHGIQPTDSKEAFFAPIDVKSSDPFATSVSIDAMTTALGESDAKFRWLIVDACRNDPRNATAIFKTRAAGAKGLVDPVKAPDSLWILQSCAPGKFSYEGGAGVDNGVFTLSLLEALDRDDPKADANGDGSLAITEILSYVTKRTNELAFEHHGASQVPRWSGAEMTEFAVLDDLLIEGLPRAKRLEADALYREACVLRRKREYKKAAEKLAQARKINAVNEEYKAEEELIAELLANQAALQEAQKTAQEAARKAEEEAAARAEAERKAEEARRQAQNAGRTSTSGTGTTSQTPTSQTPTSPTPTSSTSKPRTSSASGDWSGEYAAGTAKSLTVDGITYNFRYCPAGTFAMGSPESEEDRYSEETQHQVTLTNGFWMLETEVTQAMWKSAMGSKPSYNSPLGGNDKVRGMDTSNFPVEKVSWDDCQKFIEKLNSSGVAPKGFKFRLPTEAEWEYACRAGTTGPYAGSSLDALGWNSKNSDSRSHEVGTKEANPWGLYDMHGNVYEWCEDWYDDDFYKNANSAQDPVAATDNGHRVMRGGCWSDSARYCRSARREDGIPTSEYGFCGFRLALSPERKAEEARSQAQNSERTSTETASVSTEAAQTQPSSAREDWSGEYAAGTLKTLKINGLDYRFRYCPPGTFTMGSPTRERMEIEYSDDEGPQRRVTLTNGFWMLETEVTQAMWESAIEATSSKFEMDPNLSEFTSSERNPVENVSWKKCQTFIARLNSLKIAPKGFIFRLPTEAEWEYACRAGTTGPYAGSSLDAMGWYEGNSGGRTHEVGTKEANPWGLYDMHGNVSEWCEDKYANYSVSNSRDPINKPNGPSQWDPDADRMLRGGSWKSDAESCRSACRRYNDPEYKFANYGLRFVLARYSSQ